MIQAMIQTMIPFLRTFMNTFLLSIQKSTEITHVFYTIAHHCENLETTK